MRHLERLLLLVLPICFAQAQNTTIPSVMEPPELTGPPTKIFEEPSEALKALAKAMPNNFNDAEQVKSAKAALDKLIQEHSDFGDGFSIRVMLSCSQNSKEYPAVIQDIDAALKYQKLGEKGVFNTPSSLYSIRAKIAYESGDSPKAIEDLNRSVTLDLSKAADVFNSGGVEPDTKSEPCTWNKTDLDSLVKRFPNDYRTHLFRGLYYTYFTRWKPQYVMQAVSDFNRAALTNPKSPLPPYFLGAVYDGGAWFLSPISDAEMETYRKKALAAFAQAILLDSKFELAYYSRAELYFQLKQNQQAIKDFDKALELDTTHGGAYNDRGLAKLNLNDYYGAISDLSQAITNKERLSETGLQFTYENRADAYIGSRNYEQAIQDMSEAIKLDLSNSIFLMSLTQIKKTYPEYANVSDDVLCRKLHRMFFQNLKYEDFWKQIAEENQKREGLRSTVLPGLYIKRGDTYLKAGDYRRAAIEYQRATKGFPDSAKYTDRWLALFNGSDTDFYLDTQTAEFPSAETARFWIKAINKPVKGGESSSMQNYEVSCRSKMLNTMSFIKYDANGKVIGSSDVQGGWQAIVPDTVGEQLYAGMCRQ